MALAWLYVALASKNPKPGQHCRLGLGLAWLWLRPWPGSGIFPRSLGGLGHANSCRTAFYNNQICVK